MRIFCATLRDSARCLIEAIAVKPRMLLKRLLAVAIMLALPAYCYMTFFGYDCGTGTVDTFSKRNSAEDPLQPRPLIQTTTTTTVPHRDWKGLLHHSYG